MAVTTELLDCPAPAKLNLFLHVTGRRPDGYHLLQTAFRLLDWGDRLGFRLRADGRIRRVTEVPGVPPEDDLVVRAAHALRDWAGERRGVDILIDKHLPMGGGLGGGSSDAATTLLALNRLWGLHASRDALEALALPLGADVPFFVFGRSAFAEGVGERLTPLELPPRWYVVVAPGVSVPTAAIFGAKELTRNTKPIKIADFAMSATRNDLERVARARYPQIAAAIDWLGAIAPARMTGSGACLFSEFESERQARDVAGQCPAPWRAWAVRGLDRHPLFDWAG
ncbi:4-(cytidine 5'-diphospho)-2-C-methyl-D-erythritol kinase [Nitrogeniibacter mangrovi]|uniref:4-diphosphocytidyl-2-C-methyl-D-erythritol kinase n=1 Tax=Nitrogeniibacter mangrovi TaxID=2016596 RepID=A0A6C1B9G1_9RHOO|nr:4-(cytidine 5'-diphospho)-2-C-methyl-D-erythritol kinase [Nitrogeniibacter mangrovi]QID18884.1 4-(cytidine 5'-diphospho)-2-C-methyl-D-erythritol kinase [Nitrogeniibacter mangrovi]